MCVCVCVCAMMQLAVRSCEHALWHIKNSIRRLLCMPDGFDGAACLDSASKGVEDAVTVYLKKTVADYNLTRIYEVTLTYVLYSLLPSPFSLLPPSFFLLLSPFSSLPPPPSPFSPPLSPLFLLPPLLSSSLLLLLPLFLLLLSFSSPLLLPPLSLLLSPISFFFCLLASSFSLHFNVIRSKRLVI
jgi:hypothetical protein